MLPVKERAGGREERWEEERRNKPPQRERGRSRGESGGRRRRGLRRRSEGAGGAEKWGMTPPLATHTSDVTGPLSHSPSPTHTHGDGQTDGRTGRESEDTSAGAERQQEGKHRGREGAREGDETQRGTEHQGSTDATQRTANNHFYCNHSVYEHKEAVETCSERSVFIVHVSGGAGNQSWIQCLHVRMVF